MAAIGGNITTMRRQLKNVVGNYSYAQIKVREATSNDPWGPSSSLMSEIADLTHNPIAFSEIMQMLWKRLNDSGKNWRHVYKSLVVLDYLVKLGSEKVTQQCRENIFAVQTLKDFQHVEDNKDQGMNVREKAKQLVALLKDEDRLKNERSKAMAAKSRFVQNGVGIASDGTTSRVKKSETFQYDKAAAKASSTRRIRRSSELDDCRPTSTGEEELQLQIALALSKEDAQKEDELRKSDDVRLQMALNESQKSQSSPDNDNIVTVPPEFSDLFDLPGPSQQISHVSNTQFVDPWSSDRSVSQKSFPDSGRKDPWRNDSSFEKKAIDPWSTAPTHGSVADPWASQNSVNAPIGQIAATESGQAQHFDDLDPFAPTSADKFNMDDKQAAKRSKTPADFLGENSALVNLDNLLGPAKSTQSQSVVSGAVQSSVAQSGRASTNPFLTGSDGRVFLPPINQVPPYNPSVYPVSSSNNQQRPESTNPFL